MTYHSLESSMIWRFYERFCTLCFILNSRESSHRTKMWVLCKKCVSIGGRGNLGGNKNLMKQCNNPIQLDWGQGWNGLWRNANITILLHPSKKSETFFLEKEGKVKVNFRHSPRRKLQTLTTKDRICIMNQWSVGVFYN